MKTVLSGDAAQEKKIHPPEPEGEPAADPTSLILLSLIHTRSEHQLYHFMLEETRRENTKIGAFSGTHLLKSGINTLGKVRRACRGLEAKLSIEPPKSAADSPDALYYYVVFGPSEVLERRRKQNAGNNWFQNTIISDSSPLTASDQLSEKFGLSRREKEVLILCSRGLNNADIGKALFIQKETVKFHMKNIFLKIGVRRRTELMSLVLWQDTESTDPPGARRA